jgi:preprotein translocase subunit SecA
MKFELKNLFSDESSRFLKKVTPEIDKINSFEDTIKVLSDEELKGKTEEFKKRLTEGETEDDILAEAFAVVREAAVRTLGMRHYDVQMIGGIALHNKNVVEMRTGEGKTLVATLPVYLNAISGKGVHVVTVNDYLSRRDTQWMGQVYDFLGLTTSVINAQGVAYMYDGTHTEAKQLEEERDEESSYKVFNEFLRPISRKEAYQADITYGTNNEFGFDYLRDNTARHIDDLVQRGHNFVIVDEVDSVLIDEARVPLILSSQAEEAEDTYRHFSSISGQFIADQDYTVDEKLRAVQLTDEGIEKAEKVLGVDNLYTAEHIKLVHHLETAVRARSLFLKDRDYVVRDGQVIIVDPFTGRMQEGRRWSDGLHQAVEAKENVSIKQESRTMASITYQNYFKFYEKLSGMTGTAVSSSEEFRKVYNMDVIVVPTNRPIQRIDQTDLIFQTEKGKFKAIAKKVRELHEKGQPVLIGTVSVENNEMLSAYLTQEGIPHELLNAKQHESEGMIVANAGRKGAVVVATNMAGRGVDIKLGGTSATKEETQEILDLGGLYVLGTERHDARRIDNQLRGRAGRQGDPGETQFFVSMEDSLMRIFGGDKVKGVLARLKIPEDEAIKNTFISKQLEKAQEKIEGFNFDARKHVLEFDDVLSTHRNSVYKRRRNILENNEEEMKKLENEILEHNPDLTAYINDKREKLGEELFIETLRQFSLFTIDRLWQEHLEVMDNAKRSVNLRGYGQREPLVEYKKESLRLYHEFEGAFKHSVSDLMSRIDVEAVQQQVKDKEKREIRNEMEGKEEIVSEHVDIIKGGEVRTIKRKKLQKYLDTGWRERPRRVG